MQLNELPRDAFTLVLIFLSPSSFKVLLLTCKSLHRKVDDLTSEVRFLPCLQVGIILEALVSALLQLRRAKIYRQQL